jgi:hypothetical protein
MTIGYYISIVPCWHKLYGIHVFRYYLKDFCELFLNRIIIYNTFVFDKCSFEHLYSDYFVSVKMQSCLFCLLSSSL